jgi:hypothetical protein
MVPAAGAATLRQGNLLTPGALGTEVHPAEVYPGAHGTSPHGVVEGEQTRLLRIRVKRLEAAPNFPQAHDFPERDQVANVDEGPKVSGVQTLDHGTFFLPLVAGRPGDIVTRR